MISMDTEFTEEEVVENPTLKAAYNLAPLHQNQPLRWDYEVDLIGKKVFDKVLHLCEVCELPILVYGRLLPCKHIFCFHCARKCEAACKRCSYKVQKVEELALGTVYVCNHGAPKHSTKGCRKTYHSQRDLQSHIAHRHMAKPSSNESKASPNVPQPQLPLTQQQAAALQQQYAPSQVSAPQHSQSNLLPSMHSQQSQQQQQALSSSPFVQQQQQQQQQQHHHHHQPPLHDVGHQQQMLAPVMQGLTPTSVSPAMSQASSDIKSNYIMPHGLAYNSSHQNNEHQGVYRPLDNNSLPPQFQQPPPPPAIHSPHQQVQQHSQQHLPHQQHLQLPLSQHQQQSTSVSQMIPRSGSPGMSSMSKSIKRYAHPLPSTVSSSMLSLQSSQGNAFQTTLSSSPAEMQMSTPLHNQPPRQSVNVHQHQQLPQHGTPQSQQFVPKSYSDAPPDIDIFERFPKRDKFVSTRHGTNIEDSDNLHSGGMQNLDNFGNLNQSRKLFNPLQDMDDRDRDFNPHKSNMMDTSSLPSGPSSRNKNVNLITVPIQDEGHYRPLPYVNQLSSNTGGSNKNFPPFSSSMSAPNNSSSNFSYSANNQAVGSGNIRPPQRMPFNRLGNPQPRLPGSGNSQGSMMLNNPRGTGLGIGGNTNPSVRLSLGASGPPPPLINMTGAMAGTVPALPRNPAPLHTSHNPRFNPPSTSGHWSVSGGAAGGAGIATGVGNNLRPIQSRMTQNLPPRGGNKMENPFHPQGYYR